MNFDNYTTIGMDVSDRKIQVCVMAKSGVNPKIVKETTIPTTKEGLQKFLSTQDKNSPVVFETGTSVTATANLRLWKASFFLTSTPPT